MTSRWCGSTKKNFAHRCRAGLTVVKHAARIMGRVDAVVVSDYAKGFAIAPVVEGIIAAARRRGKPVVVDPKGSDFERYRGATVLKPNRSELGVLTGLPARHHDETMQAARELLRRGGNTAIVVTEGKDGMTLLQPEAAEEHFPQLRARSLRCHRRGRYCVSYPGGGPGGGRRTGRCGLVIEPGGRPGGGRSGHRGHFT